MSSQYNEKGAWSVTGPFAFVYNGSTCDQSQSFPHFTRKKTVQQTEKKKTFEENWCKSVFYRYKMEKQV